MEKGGYHTRRGVVHGHKRFHDGLTNKSKQRKRILHDRQQYMGSR